MHAARNNILEGEIHVLLLFSNSIIALPQMIVGGFFAANDCSVFEFAVSMVSILWETYVNLYRVSIWFDKRFLLFVLRVNLYSEFNRVYL